jgi:hypothetical protein
LAKRHRRFFAGGGVIAEMDLVEGLLLKKHTIK